MSRQSMPEETEISHPSEAYAMIFFTTPDICSNSDRISLCNIELHRLLSITCITQLALSALGPALTV